MHVDWSEAFDRLLWNEDGLLPVTTVEKSNGTVLMSAWINREALQLAFEKKKAVYWSRSRQELWVKGETSGNYQILHEVRVDCDGDAVLYLVEALGPTCHTGRQSCFSWKLSVDEGIVCDRPVLESH
jgi:phosphoribosyl-AMP cyclohydrolase